jgi:hypothetical protein
MAAPYPRYMYHTGPSMYPTLRPGDRVCIVPYNGQEIRRGDVIAFIPGEENRKITHRIISIDWQGVKTRGDNNNRVDGWVLQPVHILGRVVYAQGRKGRRLVFGGLVGHLFALAVRVIHRLESSVSDLLRPCYERMARAEVFSRWPFLQRKIRVVSFNRPTGRELHLLMGKRVIGRWLAGRGQWRIRRPFRLFVDETSLPENVSESKS